MSESDSEQLRRIRLDAEWQAFKQRFDVYSFGGDDNQLIDESTLSDNDKRMILARYSGRPPVTLIDLTPERRPARQKTSRLRKLVRRVVRRR